MELAKTVIPEMELRACVIVCMCARWRGGGGGGGERVRAHEIGSEGASNPRSGGGRRGHRASGLQSM